MATSSNLSSILRFYAEKQKSPFIDLREFCAYIKKYAEHHVEEQADLVKYLGDPTNTVTAELTGLEAKHLAATIPNGNKKMIVSVSYFTQKFLNQYNEILKNEAIAYPVESDLPKKFPTYVLEKKQAEQYIIGNIENQNTKSSVLYELVFTHDLPGLLVPACIPIKVLIETSQKKIRKLLKKDEYHDYFLKKLRSSNPQKEITIKNFFTHFIDQATNSYMDVSEGDDYYLWNQLCYFIRQDFEKIQDRTGEDTNVLQAIQISEIYNTYLKQKFNTNKRREEALKELESQLNQSPYFFSMNQILKFHDKNGKLLYGQFTEDDLKNFLQTKTKEEQNALPTLLVFKVASGTRYYVYKKKVLSLVVRLCNEAHDCIEAELVKRWYESLLNYEKLPEMTDKNKFEESLAKQVEISSPVLYALLNATFMSLMALEKSDIDDNMSSYTLFENGKLKPYSELLILTSDQVMNKAKMNLPVLYTIPIISWIISLFRSNKKNKQKSSEVVEETKNPFEENNEDAKKSYSKAEALAEQAIILTDDFIPEGSTIDRELNYLNKQWNKMITKEANFQLTEDVNSLIRDYTRRVVRTLSAVSFTRERVINLAETLVKTPNMQKIGEQKALQEYVQLYILRLVSNSKKK